MKKNAKNIIAVAVIVGLTINIACADMQGPPFSAKPGTLSGIGSFTGCAKWTNSTGTLWITPTNGVTSGTFTDNSQFGSNYVSVVTITPLNNPFGVLYATNTITFPVTNTTKYEFIVYVKSPVPPPTNNQPLNLELDWH